MRRTITIAAAIAMLVGAAAAYAALNTYTASFSFSGKAGSKSQAGVDRLQARRYSAANAIPGDRAAPLTKIVTKVYGLMSNDGKYFPKCTLATIAPRPNCDKALPEGLADRFRPGPLAAR